MTEKPDVLYRVMTYDQDYHEGGIFTPMGWGRRHDELEVSVRASTAEEAIDKAQARTGREYAIVIEVESDD